MADDWKRRREKEQEEEEREAAIKKRLAGGESSTSGIPVEKLIELIDRADILIDQLNNSYNMYVTGAEKLPPRERRKALDQMMVTIAYTGKPTQAMLFKCNGMVSRYNTHKERWDRLVKDLESGKIKRVTGPQVRVTRKAA